MKILEKKSDHVSWWSGNKETCFNCNSKIEIEANDVPCRHEAKGKIWEVACFKCPVCDNEMLVTRIKLY